MVFPGAAVDAEDGLLVVVVVGAEAKKSTPAGWMISTKLRATASFTSNRMKGSTMGAMLPSLIKVNSDAGDCCDRGIDVVLVGTGVVTVVVVIPTEFVEAGEVVAPGLGVVVVDWETAVVKRNATTLAAPSFTGKLLGGDGAFVVVVVNAADAESR